MSRYETPATIAEAIDDFRTAHAAIRKIEANGGRTAATSNALARHQATADRAIRALINDNQRAIVGDLTQEQGLIARLASDMPAAHREWLTGRLSMVRADIHRWTRVIGAYELAA